MTYTPRLTPRAHQIEAMRRLTLRPSGFDDVFAWFQEMGTGKTYTALNEWGARAVQNDVPDLLVIAPAGCYHNWHRDKGTPGQLGYTPSELKKHLDPELYVRLRTCAWISGAGMTARNEMSTFLGATDRPRAFFVNIEALSTVEKARQAVLDFLGAGRAMMVVDECFTGETKISTPNGQVRIDALSPGDVVTSSQGVGVVKELMSKRTQVTVSVRTRKGEIVTTPNHPFFTDLGWVCASNLEGRTLLDDKDVMWVLQPTIRDSRQVRENEKILQSILCSEITANSRNQEKTKYSRSKCEDICQLETSLLGRKDDWSECRPRDQKEKIFISGKEYETISSLYGRAIDGTWCRGVEQRYPDEGVFTKETERQIKECWSPPEDSWWERAYTSSSSATSVGSDGFWLGGGVPNHIGRKAAWLSNMLQSRLGVSQREDGGGVRWWEPQRSICRGSGQEERRQIEGVRVESITVKEHRDFINVFDLELEGCPHFFAGEVLVHNSTRIRAPDTKRTDWIVRAGRGEFGRAAAARRIMSGLPTPKAPTDLFSQMEFLDVRILGHRSYFTFRQHYAVMRQIRTGQLKKLKSGKTVPATAWVDVAYRNEEELAARIAPHSYRILKSECLDLPPKLYMPPREVEMTDEQAKAYRELVSQATTELECGAAVSPKRKITQILRLHQVLQGFVKSDDGVIRYIKSNRIRALLEVLEEAAGKVVIWVSYDESVRAVTEALEREYGPGSVARYWGGNLKTRHEDEVRYLGDPRCRFMVSTPAAGGIGNTWVVGQLAVYLSGTPDLEHRLQSEDRTHRDGQTGQATYQDFYVPGTVDERIMEINREKIDMASALLGDGYREWLQWR